MVREYRVNPEKVHLELKEIFEKSEWKGINLRTEPFIINSQSLEELSLLPTDELRKEINKMYEEALIRKEGPTYYHKKRLVSVDEVIIFDENLPSSNPYRRLNLDNHVEREIARNFDRIKFEELAHGVQHITGLGDNKGTIHLSDLTYEFKDKYGEGSSELKLIKEGDEYKIKVLYDDTRSEADIAAFFKEHNPELIDDIFLNTYPERKTIIDFVNREKSIQNSLPYSEIASGSMRDLIEGIGLRVHAGQKTLSELSNVKPDLSDLDIARIQRGEFYDYEIERINDARQLLREKGLNRDIQLLDDKEVQKELLFSHYSGNKVEGINVFTKAKPLLKQGFSKGSLKLLMDKNNRVLGLNALIDDSSIDHSIRRLDPENLGTALGSTRIVRSNVDKLFTHQPFADNPKLRAIKGISYIDEDGQYHVRFWSTGDGIVGNNVHHRDALSNLIDEEADNLIERGIEINNDKILDNGIRRKSIAVDISEIRTQDSFPDNILTRSHGFQFIIDDTGKIIRFDIDSSIISAQISKGIVINSQELSNMIKLVHESIEPSLRGYKVIRIKSLEDLKLNSPLNLPDGLKAIQLLWIILFF